MPEPTPIPSSNEQSPFGSSYPPLRRQALRMERYDTNKKGEALSEESIDLSNKNSSKKPSGRIPSGLLKKLVCEKKSQSTSLRKKQTLTSKRKRN